MNHKHIIGIDPDVKKSGIAHLNTHTRNIELMTLAFWELYEYLKVMKETYDDRFIVVIEAGWLVEKSNFHGQSGTRAQRIAKNVGSNHETGRKIVEMCEYLEIEHAVKAPLKKIWMSNDGKVSHRELAYFTGLQKHATNQEERDAALIAWEYAGFPIKILPIRLPKPVGC